jgi:hypothetical protein
MELINALLLVAGGILAVSSLIVAKKPDAQKLIDKLVPYQAVIGIALLAFGIVNLLRLLDHLGGLLRAYPMFAMTLLALCVTSILLGFMFGMPQISKWIPGENAAEQKGMELSKKLAPYQVIIGLIGLASALLWLLYWIGIMSVV